MSTPKKIDLRLLASLAHYFRPGKQGFLYPSKFCPEFNISNSSYHRRLEHLIKLGLLVRIETFGRMNPVIKLNKSAYILLNENRSLISLFNLIFKIPVPNSPNQSKSVPRIQKTPSTIIRPEDHDFMYNNATIKYQKSSKDSNKDIDDGDILTLYNSLRGIQFLTKMNLSQFKRACKERKGTRTLYEIKEELDILLWCLEKKRIGYIKDLPLFFYSVIVNGSKHVLNSTEESQFFEHRYRDISQPVKEAAALNKQPIIGLSDTDKATKLSIEENKAWRIQHLRSLYDKAKTPKEKEKIKKTIKSACKSSFGFAYSDLRLGE